MANWNDSDLYKLAGIYAQSTRQDPRAYFGMAERQAKRDAEQKERERLQAAQQKVTGLMGRAQAPYQMGETELFPGETQAEAIRGGLPTGAPLEQQISAPQGLMTKGTGLLGGEVTPTEFYGGLMTTPGYKNIGAQGLQSIATQKGLMSKQAAKEKTDLGKTDFDRSEKLRKSFEGQTKDFVKVRDANRRIGAAAQNPTAAGDMALIFNFMKVLDPGSTVREGEFATAQNATGVPNRVMNMYNNILSGERLNPDQRIDFVGQADNLYQAQLGGLSQLEDQYTGLATRYGLDPKNIVVDYRVKQTEKRKPKTPPPPAGFK